MIMTEKLKAGKKAFLLVIVLVAVSVIMAVSSYLFPESLSSREMVTGTPRAAAEVDPNHTECIRCAGTDCVVWLPDNLSVTESRVFGREGDLSFLLLASDGDAFTDESREEILSGFYEPLAGTERNVSVAVSETGYLYLEKVAYEEMYVRTKVSLRTQKSYVFVYLIKNEQTDCRNTIVAVACEGKARAEDARDLAMSIAGSYQRFRDQREEVQGALFDEATVSRTGGEDSSPAGDEDAALEAVGVNETGDLVIDAVISVGRSTAKGDVLIFMWENDFAEPKTFQVTAPSGAELEKRPESSSGLLVFEITGSERADGWHVQGTAEQELGTMAPLLFDANEYHETFGY